MFCRPFHRVLSIWLASASLPVSTAVAEILPGTVVAQPFTLHRWTTENNLPQNTVNYLAQTPDGYLWAGTRTGLARFDGVRFTVFTRELLMNGQGDLSCRDLEVDGKGRLWIRLPDALVCYHQGRFERFSTESGPLQSDIQTMIASRESGLWIGTRGQGLKRFENGAFTRLYRAADGLGTDWVGLLNEDGQGRVWIGCTDRDWPIARSWQRLDPVSGELVSLSEVLGFALTNIWDLFPDHDGRLWATLPGQLLCWAEGKLTRYDTSAIWNHENPGRIKEDNTGALWLAPGNGTKAVRFKDGRWDVFNLENQGIDRDIREVLPDREGNVWVGTGAQGLLQIQPQRIMSLLTKSPGGGNQEIHSVAAGAGDVVWLATGSRLLRFQHDAVEHFAVGSDGRALTQVQAALEDRSGQVWVKCHGGLLKLTKEGLTRVPGADAGRSNWVVTALREDRRGRLWIGSDSGLLEHRDGTFILYTTRDGLSDDAICGIRDAPDGSLWVGTQSGELNHLKDGRFHAYSTRDGLLPGRVIPLAVEEDGTIWTGTPTGLNRIRAGEIRAVTEREGLLDHETYSLLDDKRGHYWAHCNRGIFRVRQADLHAVADGRQRRLHCVSYGKADGMASTEGNGDYQPNAARLPDGRMWFPMTRGVVVFDPGEVMETDVPPPIVIEQVQADDEVIYGDGVAQRWSAAVPNRSGHDAQKVAAASQAMSSIPRAAAGDSRAPVLRLPAGRARWLKIHYTANSFFDPRRVRFQYRLTGHDRDWRKMTDERVAYYADLKPGHYRFQVKAANPHGVWNETPAVFEFSLAPHFYETWPFYILCVTGAVLAGLGVHHRRVRGLRRLQHLEQQRALLDERARIARDLHDDLGANLTGIALKADLAQRQLQGPQAVGQLAEIAANTRALVDNMRGTVWALNPKHDTLEGLARFLAQQVEDFVTDAGLRCRLELPGEFPGLTVPSPARYHIHLVVKEGLHNAVKHAGAREIRFSLQMDGSDLCLCLADDGQGFELNDSQLPTLGSQPSGNGGNGLLNMRQRVESLGGRWELASGCGQGTRISIPTQSFRPKST